MLKVYVFLLILITLMGKVRANEDFLVTHSTYRKGADGIIGHE